MSSPLRMLVAMAEHPEAWSQESLDIINDCAKRLIELGHKHTVIESLAVPYIEGFYGRWFIQMGPEDNTIGLCTEDGFKDESDRPGFRAEMTEGFTGKEMADRVHEFLEQERERIRVEAKEKYDRIWGHLKKD